MPSLTLSLLLWLRMLLIQMSFAPPPPNPPKQTNRRLWYKPSCCKPYNLQYVLFLSILFKFWPKTTHPVCYVRSHYVPICNLNILPGIPRAFDTLPFPESRVFDFRTAAGVGNLTPSRERWGIWPFIHESQTRAKRNFMWFSRQEAFVTEWLTKNGP